MVTNFLLRCRSRAKLTEKLKFMSAIKMNLSALLQSRFVRALDNQIDSLKEQLAASKEAVKVREKQLGHLTATPTTEDAIRKAEKYRAEVRRLAILRSQSQPISKADMSRVDGSLAKYKSFWAKRRRLCRVLLNAVVDIADACGAEREGGGRMRKEDVAEESGIDTDEMVGAHFETFDEGI
ncbi:hypothetical protein HDU93_004501 [Gonapodya sp. JEL0774]|nr:hypothetical protein HDU93_004501 [Gonapodya sp. JEL0774]